MATGLCTIDWIYYNEQLPPEEGYYLISVEEDTFSGVEKAYWHECIEFDDTILEAIITNTYFAFVIFGDPDYIIRNPVAWAYMPEPATKKEE